MFKLLMGIVLFPNVELVANPGSSQPSLSFYSWGHSSSGLCHLCLKTFPSSFVLGCQISLSKVNIWQTASLLETLQTASPTKHHQTSLHQLNPVPTGFFPCLLCTPRLCTAELPTTLGHAKERGPLGWCLPNFKFLLWDSAQRSLPPNRQVPFPVSCNAPWATLVRHLPRDSWK